MSKQKFVSPVLMWIIVIIGVFVSFRFFPQTEIFPRNPITSFLIVPAGIYWLYFFVGALRVHKKAALSAEKIDKVVTSGIYQIVRHPIYSADIILAWGIFFHWPYLKILLSVIWLTLVLIFWMRLEEKALAEKFGEEYSNYKKNVPMFVTKFFKK
ncbi:MAG: hypothetical protein A3J63_00010 [Candidatus Moranbacteria bacterium RIFCSPHIGHO2_02_FULL_40_12b]|nr:MAG: hypothetical protein A3J63_00010 [Candidatus Moranbacteria bacterium RIFCSPHIGHO2_02_FULL_40_12b]